MYLSGTLIAGAHAEIVDRACFNYPTLGDL